MSEQAEGTNTWLFAFSMEGFECIINLTNMDEEYVLAKLAGDKLPQSVGSVMHMITLRARFNGQRRMEVWTLGATTDINQEDLEAWAESDPQGLVDQVRARGRCFYGDNGGRKPVIT